VKESKIQSDFIKLCKKRGWDALKHVCPGRAGEPDVEVRVTDVKGNGHAAYVEMKRPGEEPSALQEHVLNELRRMGFVAGWHDHAEEAVEMIMRSFEAKGIEL